MFACLVSLPYCHPLAIYITKVQEWNKGKGHSISISEVTFSQLNFHLYQLHKGINVILLNQDLYLDQLDQGH